MAHKDLYKRIRSAYKRGELFRLIFREEIITQAYSHGAKQTSYRQAELKKIRQDCRKLNQALGGN